MSIE
jgi:hypothetical protein